MAASKADLSDWFARGVQLGATHMIVVVDTFDYEDYPLFVCPGDDFWSIHDQHNGPNMTKVMEVYDLAADKWEQLNEHRAFHYPPRPGVQPEPRTPDNMPPGMLAQADQLQAQAAEHREATERLVAEALAAGPLPEGDDFWSVPEAPRASFKIPMDRESNWDICPVCRDYLSYFDEFPGIDHMRQYHQHHKMEAVSEKAPEPTNDWPLCRHLQPPHPLDALYPKPEPIVVDGERICSYCGQPWPLDGDV